jgi:hypothetical protein
VDGSGIELEAEHLAGDNGGSTDGKLSGTKACGSVLWASAARRGRSVFAKYSTRSLASWSTSMRVCSGGCADGGRLVRRAGAIGLPRELTRSTWHMT